MYLRLIDAGARGQTIPQMVVHHLVHPERLHKIYYRSWSFWNGASKGVISAGDYPLLGMSLYAYGDAFRGLFT